MKVIFFVLASIPVILGTKNTNTCADANGTCGFAKCNPNCETVCSKLGIDFHGHNSQCGVSGNYPNDRNNRVKGAERYCAKANEGTCCQCKDLGPAPEPKTCGDANGVCGFAKCNPNCESVCDELGVEYHHNSQCGVSGNSANSRNNRVDGAESYCDAKNKGDTCCQCNKYDVFDGEFEDDYILNTEPTKEQCDDWNSFRATLTNNDYTKITLSGSEDTTGVSCTGADANTLCTALNTGKETQLECDGMRWKAGSDCSGDTILLIDETDVNDCACSEYAIRPCHLNNNWGGVDGSCGEDSQSLKVVCEKT